jgi:uncharacterized membrane protein
MEEGPSATEHEIIDQVLDVIEHVAVAIEVLAVAVITIGIVYALSVYLIKRTESNRGQRIEREFRERLGQSLLVGLEILVAADVIRTVALEPSLESVAVLGVLVLIRTFLSWSIVVEMEGRWPWNIADAERSAATIAKSDVE